MDLVEFPLQGGEVKKLRGLFLFLPGTYSSDLKIMICNLAQQDFSLLRILKTLSPVFEQYFPVMGIEFPEWL